MTDAQKAVFDSLKAIESTNSQVTICYAGVLVLHGYSVTHIEYDEFMFRHGDNVVYLDVIKNNLQYSAQTVRIGNL